MASSAQKVGERKEGEKDLKSTEKGIQKCKRDLLRERYQGGREVPLLRFTCKNRGEGEKGEGEARLAEFQ